MKLKREECKMSVFFCNFAREIHRMVEHRLYYCYVRFHINKLMKSDKVLFITQEITPYVPETPMACMGRKLPQLVQESGRQIRTFMPRWGAINERRNMLHEVIRLSGMNIIIDDTDHTLVIKVASIQQARMQVYFIDNDDYFYNRGMLMDEQGVEYTDNIERAIFYARGVLETVKKLRWIPDVIHCHGWISAIAPLLIKTAYHDEPAFKDAKVVYSVYGETPKNKPASNFRKCLKLRNIDDQLLDDTKIDFSSPDALAQLAVNFSDGLIQTEVGAGVDTIEYACSLGKPILEYPGEPTSEAYTSFYESL